MKIQISDLITSGIIVTHYVLLLRKIEYLQKSPSGPDTLYLYTTSNHPQNLEKKIKLLLYFKNYLEGGDKTVIVSE